jgi:hypothetical protein
MEFRYNGFRSLEVVSMAELAEVAVAMKPLWFGLGVFFMLYGFSKILS